MHSRIRMYGAALSACLALALAIPTGLSARPKPGVARSAGFRLFARSSGASTVNRASCGLLSRGWICTDSTGSSTVPGAFWPKGSPNQYVFNSGMQFAGIVDNPGGAWNGDTTGAFFFDANGNLSHGEEIQPIYNFQNSSDAASWPAAANVPLNDRGSSTFYPLLQGLKSASQGDIWFMTWDGNPSFTSGRSHPLGIMVETRMMGWNYPTGNQDILYLVYTFYNISSTCDADYAGIRPDMKAILLDAAGRFQALNNAASNITLPQCGYNIKNFYANMGADPDVSVDATNNYASVNLPFQLGFQYEQSFEPSGGSYVLPSDLGAGTGEFVGGIGFFGMKYLASPDSAPGKPVGLTLFNSTRNGVDPNDVVQLYRFISGNLIPGIDPACNTGLPLVTHICNIFTTSFDVRMAQSSGPFDLPAGGSGSVVVAYLFASAVKAGPCQVPAEPTVGPCGDLKPGDPRKMTSVTGLVSGDVNVVDSMTGFRKYNSSGETTPVESHFDVAPGSLLAKANVAQAVFDFKFLLPFAPAAPDFFLVPGDNQVSVFWRPSTTENTGDLFYSVASQAGTPTAPNPLYDPNYRDKDVEGYRVYRGRTQSQLSVIAQFDYAGTTISDYDGVINPDDQCAPDLGVTTSCAGVYNPIVAGVARTKHVDYPINGDLIQVALNSRLLLANGRALATTTDTAVTGAASGKFPKLGDTGVPFVFVDTKALNNLRYFYAVTAFDVNSLQSGPSSLESAPNVKSVIPVHPATNWDNSGSLTLHLSGRGVPIDGRGAPTINATTGVFSGPAQPATGASLAFIGALVKQVVTQSGVISYTLDSTTMGSAFENGLNVAGTANHYFLTIVAGPNTTHSDVAVIQDQAQAETDVSGTITGASLDPVMAGKYGGNSSYHLAANFQLKYSGGYYTQIWGRACANQAISTPCLYQGPRWFDGPSPQNNETHANPNAGEGQPTAAPTGAAPWLTNFNNVGALTGVSRIYEGHSYQTMALGWRGVEGAVMGAGTAADYNVYWGTTAGTVDSVVDVTHNVLVPFSADVKHGYTWGFLNQAATTAVGSYDTRPGVLTLADLGCLDPIKGLAANNAGSAANGGVPCTAAAPYALQNTAVPGTMAFFQGNIATGTSADAKTNPAAAGKGFIVYLPGHFFQVEMDSLGTGAAPAKPAVWTLRTYVGSIRGGKGIAGDSGSYRFTAKPSPLVAPGVTVAATYTVVNKLHSATAASLNDVHTVPDPYYVTNAYEVSPSAKIIKFVNLPQKCIIRIYSTSGVLVRVLEDSSNIYSSEEDWDVRNRNNQVVASGVYFYSIEASSGPRTVKRLTIVNFAQ